MFQKILKVILFFALIGGLVYAFSGTIDAELSFLHDKYFPCTTPIKYELVSFDPRFGISKADFLQVLSQAENLWEKAAGRQLFTYVPTDPNINPSKILRINLVYDYRQEATAKINNLVVSSSGNRAEYDSLKAQYNSLQANYSATKKDHDARVAAFQSRQNAYDAEVNEWNQKGGAPKDAYARLEAEKASLQTEFNNIKKTEDTMNNLMSQINSLVPQINSLAKTLNISAGEFNSINQTRGEQFTEGEYKSDLNNREINVYEFSTKTKLKVVLAHELGHALGLDHVSDPKAIMYRLNQNTDGMLTRNDLTALKAFCKIK